MTPPLEPHWDFTQSFHEKAAAGLLPKVNIGNRELIGRDTPINGGFSASDREPDWIIVDDQQDTTLQLTYYEVKRRIEDSGRHPKEVALNEVYKYVREKIPYDEGIYDRIAKDRGNETRLLPLSYYFEGGVCRHQALLAAYLIEKLIGSGVLGGKVSFESNHYGIFGAHAWVRYVSRSKRIFIIDTSIGFAGELHPNNNDLRWGYERPEEIKAQLELLAAKTQVMQLPSGWEKEIKRRAKPFNLARAAFAGQAKG
jgi:hypothetical protein